MICLQNCPSGYIPSGVVCIYEGNHPIFDMILGTLTPTIKTDTGQTILNGATLAYCPFYELSDPSPIQHRSANFSGYNYIQLPPASFTSGAPLILAILYLNQRGFEHNSLVTKLLFIRSPAVIPVYL